METRPALDQRYELLRVLGRGGWATVHEAEDRLLHRRVALKLLLPHFKDDAAFIERFVQEARIAGRLNHPNIVGVYDVGLSDEAVYIVLELLPGGSLKELIAQEAPLPPDRVVEIGDQLCAALDYAHAHGVIHRDVKPHNVLFSEEGVVKLTDFGIARAVAASSHTATGTVWTSVQYAAPEQVTGGKAIPASDLYALGVVLYQMATGRVPFEADTPLAIALKHVNEAPPPLRSLNPAFPAGLEATIHRLLQKQPEHRFRSAQEVSAALRGGPVGPIAPRSTRRWPAFATVAIGMGAVSAVAGLVLLAGAGGREFAGLMTGPSPTPETTATPAATVTASPAPTATPILVQGFDGAAAFVARQGYTAGEAAGYNPDLPLQVIVGNGNGERAFFFYQGRYLGTDTSGPSADVSLAGHDGQTVTLRYMLYAPGSDEPVGDALARFQWNGSRLVPLDPLPPEDPNAPLSRR